MNPFNMALINLEEAVFSTMGDEVMFIDNVNNKEIPIRVIITEQLVEDQTGYEQNRFNHILNQYIISIDRTTSDIKPVANDSFVDGTDTYKVIGDKYNDGSMLNIVCSKV